MHILSNSDLECGVRLQKWMALSRHEFFARLNFDLGVALNQKGLDRNGIRYHQLILELVR